MTSYDLKESANAKQIKPKLKTPHVDVCGCVGRGDIVPLTPAINTFPHESRQTSGNHERCQPRSLFRSVSHWGLNMEHEQCACSRELLNVDACVRARICSWIGNT